VPQDPTFTRRTLIRTSAAAGITALGSSALPGWAKPIVHGARLRRPDSLPFPHLPAGTPSLPEIKQVVVLIMENHSFDNLLGMLPYEVRGRRHVDGLTRRHHRFLNFNPDASGNKVFAQHASTPCQLHAVPSQSWNASHESYDEGRMDGFVRASTDIAMRFWDKRDIPFTYSLARHFPIGQRFFCSTLCQTYPNRRFFFAGTASGSIDDKAYALATPAANGTIFDRLDAHHIGWRVYFEEVPSPLILPNFRGNASQTARLTPIAQFYTDAAAGNLPSFTFLDPNYTTTSEENPQDIQVGEQFVAKVVHALMSGPGWQHTALFLTYDEHGGLYDHVVPPPACAPDGLLPQIGSGDPPGGFNQYGIRVPMVVVSPYAKPHYVGHHVYDHTSILRFIEARFTIGALSARDANAEAPWDMFDFVGPPQLLEPQKISLPAVDLFALLECERKFPDN
jgi:phospholipase C